jgi:bifunctional non-homologous end joining protein LigD
MRSLAKYSKKRRFKRTPEPRAKAKASKFGNIFVVQKHIASQLHYDFRLEFDGVLKSWAVPKGPSPDPSIKRLAVEVEDHPVEYANFEGPIPEGEYGGGTVMIWDRGTYEPQNGEVSAGLKKGELKFTLKGKKLKGSWVLVRTNGRQWLLIKHRDRYASDADLAVSAPRSVVTGGLWLRSPKTEAATSRRPQAQIRRRRNAGLERRASAELQRRAAREVASEGAIPGFPALTRLVRRTTRAVAP